LHSDDHAVLWYVIDFNGTKDFTIGERRFDLSYKFARIAITRRLDARANKNINEVLFGKRAEIEIV